jgi:catechol 2,3-dioxygenase-like lactoylglutathione lyase family enzyme
MFSPFDMQADAVLKSDIDRRITSLSGAQGARIVDSMTTFHGFDHVQLPVPVGSGPVARHFYELVLGLRELRDPVLDRPGTLRYAFGNQRIDLTEGRYTSVAPQAHLALRVTDLPALRRRILSAAIPIQDAPLHDGGRLYVEDPFGNRLELIESSVPHVPRLATTQFSV